ncbi:MAG: hypothetical protein WD768_00840 [Phycisphaeraceae bacterium]
MCITPSRAARPFLTFALIVAALLSAAVPVRAEEEKGKIAALKDKAIEATKKKVTETLADLKEASGVIREGGFVMGDVSIEVGLLPSVAVEFLVKDRVSDEKKVEMLEKHEDRKILTAVLKALFAAQEMDVAGYKLERVEMKVSLSPKTKLVFVLTE